jgi:hypothetical protein
LVPSEEVASRFWAKVDMPEEGCWPWRAAARSTDGIGVFGFNGQVLYAHRVAYTLAFGVIPAGGEVRRTCSESLCVRPKHLVLIERGKRDSVKDLEAAAEDDGTVRYLI